MKERKKKKRILLTIILGILLAAAVVLGIQLHRILYKPLDLFVQESTKAGTPTASTADTVSVEAKQEQEQPAAAATLPPEEAVLVPTQEPVENDPFKKEMEEKGIVNFLVLGVDGDSEHPEKSYSDDNHTDTILLVAVNFKTNKVDMVSIQRDTFRQIPGSSGYYKINAAVNVGGGFNDPNNSGYLKTCEVVSQMLGGIPVDYFIALYFDSVVELVDSIGGVDYYVEGWFDDYTTVYPKGQQLMDGKAVLGYLRTRKSNRTEMDTGDAARVDRQKRMLLAIYKKVREQNMLTMIPPLLNTLKGITTNVSTSQMLALANYAMGSIDEEDISMHTLGAPVRQSDKTPWNFAFTNQDKRIALIQDIYGVTVEPEPYTSYAHLLYMEEYGFPATRSINIAAELIAAAGEKGLSEAQQALLDTVMEKKAATEAAIEEAALSLVDNPKPQSDTCRRTKTVYRELQQACKELADSIDYTLPGWSIPKGQWWMDPYINNVIVDFR